MEQCSKLCVLLMLLGNLGVYAQEIYLCVWRNPERTMSKIFPEAKDYVTVNKTLTENQTLQLEAELGFKILPGQRDRFQYFNLLDASGKKLGTVIASSQKGEFGAIEFVTGFDQNGKIKNLYIQRSRERNVDFKKKEFLEVFKNKDIHQWSQFSKEIPLKSNSGKVDLGKTALVQGLQKELAVYLKLGEK